MIQMLKKQYRNDGTCFILLKMMRVFRSKKSRKRERELQFLDSQLKLLLEGKEEEAIKNGRVYTRQYGFF